jgi:PAS domain S-box-containing protein
MADTHPNPEFINTAVPSSQRVIEILAQLQAQAREPIPSCVYIYDLVEQHTIYSSTSVAAILGYASAQIDSLGFLGLAKLIHPLDLQKVSEHFQRFLTLREGEVIAVEYRMKRPDGTWGWLRSHDIQLVQAIDGFPLQVLGIIQDITQYSPHARSKKRATSGRSFGQSLATLKRMGISHTRWMEKRRRRFHLSKKSRPKTFH